MLGRALLARCPRCGGGALFASWFRTKERCPTCDLRLQRGESHDYWLGGMMFNIVLAEGVAVAVIVVGVLSTWPDVPWNLIWVGTITLMIASPFALYPISRLVWLAFDLTFRPLPDESYK